MKDRHIDIFFSDKDGGYAADIPDLASGFGLPRDPQSRRRQRY